MSNSDSENNALKNIATTINDLRTGNPKVFYGTIGVIVVLFLLLFMGGGTGESPQIRAALATGETYSLVNPNGGAVLLVAVPGKFSSVEYREEDSQNVCAVKSGTKAVVQEETFQNFIHYVKVKPSEGECQGKSGWTSKVNITR